MKSAARLAQDHWNATPLFLAEESRYAAYPWLYGAAEFADHSGERVLEVGCGTGADLLQFAKNGAVATGVDITTRHLELAHARVQGAAGSCEPTRHRCLFPTIASTMYIPTGWFTIAIGLILWHGKS